MDSLVRLSAKTTKFSYAKAGMLGWTLKMLGRTLSWTFIDPIFVVFIGHNSNWQLYWAQKTDAVTRTSSRLCVQAITDHQNVRGDHVELYGSPVTLLML